MAGNVAKIAELLGGRVVARVPDAGGGAFGAARLAAAVAALRSRPQPGPGEPPAAAWVSAAEVPMTAATQAKLARLAERASAGGRRVSPIQLAAQLLEDAVAALPDA